MNSLEQHLNTSPALDDLDLQSPPPRESVNHTTHSSETAIHSKVHVFNTVQTQQESIDKALKDLKSYNFTEIHYISSTAFKGLKALNGRYSAPSGILNAHIDICGQFIAKTQSNSTAYHNTLGIKKFNIALGSHSDPTTVYALSLYGPAGQNATLYGFVPSTVQLNDDEWDEIYARAQRLHLKIIQQSKKKGEVIALTSRENDIMRCIIKGKSNNDIARYLGISVRTVNGHISRIFLKTNTSDRLSACLYALQNALVS